MPHLTLEYTSNLSNFSPTAALTAINAATLASGLFEEADIKSRAIALDTFQIGGGAAASGFAHVRIALLAGRTSEVRKALADAVLTALTAAVNRQNGLEIQLSVETVDLDRPSYAKATIDG